MFTVLSPVRSGAGLNFFKSGFGPRAATNLTLYQMETRPLVQVLVIRRAKIVLAKRLPYFVPWLAWFSVLRGVALARAPSETSLVHSQR